MARPHPKHSLSFRGSPPESSAAPAKSTRLGAHPPHRQTSTLHPNFPPLHIVILYAIVRIAARTGGRLRPAPKGGKIHEIRKAARAGREHCRHPHLGRDGSG